ncbi:hypothetical protein BH09BAC2_BH09BAC2_05280 [soil metagenome]
MQHSSCVLICSYKPSSMNYNKIISVTGLGGLYELVSSKSDGAVVRSLEDNTTKFVSTRQHNFSHLESIEVYTVNENTTLSEVFKSIKESTEPMPDEKADGKELKAYFQKVVPELDLDRVYASDMKKMIRWFNILNQNDIDFTKVDSEGNDIPMELKPEKKTAPTTSVKPVKSATRKIESRGVK